MNYAVVIERTGNPFSVQNLDLLGCVTAGDTRAETEALIRETVVEHLELLREGGDLIPEPQASSSLVDVQGAAAAPLGGGQARAPPEQVSGLSMAVSRKRLVQGSRATLHVQEPSLFPRRWLQFSLRESESVRDQQCC